MSFPGTRLPVLGTPISLISYEQVEEGLSGRRAEPARVVAVCNVHSVMSARKHPELAAALRRADIATPDGMPLVWALRAMGGHAQKRVYGPDLMRRALTFGVAHGWSHFLYGTTSETLAHLEEAIRRFAPRAHIAGRLAPPFSALTVKDDAESIESIKRSGARVVWVGLGMPKQELWMDRVREHLPGVTLVGVGAAFDILAGNVPQAPGWMQRSGLEWLFRLMHEPRRLWRRYLWNNPAFLALAGVQIVGHRARKLLATRS